MKIEYDFLSLVYNKLDAIYSVDNPSKLKRKDN